MPDANRHILFSTGVQSVYFGKHVSSTLPAAKNWLESFVLKWVMENYSAIFIRKYPEWIIYW